MKDMMIGVDLAKRVFQVHGATMRGEVQFRRQLTREQFRAFMATQAPAVVVFVRQCELLGSGDGGARP